MNGVKSQCNTLRLRPPALLATSEDMFHLQKVHILLIQNKRMVVGLENALRNVRLRCLKT